MYDAKGNLRLAILAGLAVSVLLGMQSAGAAGFALREQNSSKLGNTYAGSAAVAEDASMLFLNSAGLTQLKRPSLVMNGAIIVNSQFNGLVGANAGLQGQSVVKGNDSAWGYDIGLLFNFNDRTRVGLSYRSAMKYGVAGDATFALPTSANANGQSIMTQASASTLANGPVTLAVALPASARLALAQKIGEKVELLLETSWTQWSAIPELRIKRINGVTLGNTPENWKDTMRYAIGANFQVSDAVKLRLGAAIDAAPVPNSTRTPRLPDADRTWLSAGAKVKVSDRIAMDVGYAYGKAKDAFLNQNDGSTTAYGLLNGQQETTIHILGAQATVSF